MNDKNTYDDETIARLRARLKILREEHASGQNQLRVMEQRMHELQNTLLRIAGAIAVLEEVSGEAPASGD